MIQVNSILAIVFLPLLAALVAGLGNRMLGNTVAKSITTGALFISCALSWPIFLSFIAGTAEASVTPVLHWVQSGSMTFDWALRVDKTKMQACVDFLARVQPGGEVDQIRDRVLLALRQDPGLARRSKRDLDRIEIYRDEALGFKASAMTEGLTFGLHRQNLAALVEAGLQVDVVGAAELARLLVLDPGHGLLMVARTAHADTALGHLLAWNGHLKLHRKRRGERPTPFSWRRS